jgi:anti-sigma regulatory factor (Ser/Thr protein kinase)
MRAGSFVTTLRHHALAYRGQRDLIDHLAPFVREGVELGEPVLVLERQEVNDELRDELGRDAARVGFIDMQEVGRNPARILSVWHDFLAAHPGRPARGVGEPLWPGRSPAEAAECHLHEALINRMLADVPVWIVCPYDATALDPEDLERMTHTHPVVCRDGTPAPSGGFELRLALRNALSVPLAEPTWAPPAVPFGRDDLPAMRWAVESHAVAAGLRAQRCADVAIVVSELATNSVRHAGGGGSLRSWTEGDRVVHEVRDTGWFVDPTAGSRLPPSDQPGGRGLWLVHCLSDLVQLRTSAAGTTIRVTLG